MVTEEHAAGALDGSVDPEELTTMLAQENQELRAEIERLQAENAELKIEADRYRWLRKQTPYRFKKIQDASVTDGGDVIYFHEKKFNAAIDQAMTKEQQA